MDVREEKQTNPIKRDPRAEHSIPPPDDGQPLASPGVGAAPAAALAAANDLASQSRAVVTSADPRLREMEPFIENNSWRDISQKLGPATEAGRLPPTLGLLLAVALREGGSDAEASTANDLAIRCSAALFGVPADSALALLFAKRLLRKNPAAWRTQPAPKAQVSLLFIVFALALGAGVGWALSGGLINLPVRLPR